MNTAEIVRVIRMAVDVARSCGMTQRELAEAMAHAAEEGRELGVADLELFRQRAEAARQRLEASLRNAEDALRNG
jgi:hypothetical protein